MGGRDGSLRLLAHTTVGALTGGVGGAAGAVAGTITFAQVGKALEGNSELPQGLKDTLVSAAAVAAGAAVGNGSGGAAGYNEVVNNYLNHQRPIPLFLSESEKYENAAIACNQGDVSACQIKNELAELSHVRDDLLSGACHGNLQSCSELIKDAQNKGNKVIIAKGNFAYAYSAEKALKALNPSYLENPGPSRGKQQLIIVLI